VPARKPAKKAVKKAVSVQKPPAKLVWKTEFPPAASPNPTPAPNNQGPLSHRRPLIVFPK
jgi:hypothetical protein